MKPAKLVVLFIATTLAACGQQRSSSSLQDDESDGVTAESAVSANAVASLPGKPQAVGFRIASDTNPLNVLVRIAPGSPQLSLAVWSGTNAPTTITINRQDPCTSNALGWTCRYLSDDGTNGFTVKYRASMPDTFQVTNVIKDGNQISDSDILPPPNPKDSSDTGCDPTDPLSCPWFG